MRLTRIAAAGAVALLLTGCTSHPTFQDVADQCGGTSAGILVDQHNLVLDPSKATADTLVCVTDKLLPDQKDQYRVAVAADAGADSKFQVGGFTVDVVGVAGEGSAVSFTDQ